MLPCAAVRGAVDPGVFPAVDEHPHHAHGGIERHHHGRIGSQHPDRLHLTHDVGTGVAHRDEDVVADGVVGGLDGVGARGERTLQRQEKGEDHASLRLSVK